LIGRRVAPALREQLSGGEPEKNKFHKISKTRIY
jgi:hypothetical protein